MFSHFHYRDKVSFSNTVRYLSILLRSVLSSCIPPNVPAPFVLSRSQCLPFHVLVGCTHTNVRRNQRTDQQTKKNRRGCVRRKSDVKKDIYSTAFCTRFCCISPCCARVPLCPCNLNFVQFSSILFFNVYILSLAVAITYTIPCSLLFATHFAIPVLPTMPVCV